MFYHELPLEQIASVQEYALNLFMDMQEIYWGRTVRGMRMTLTAWWEVEGQFIGQR